MRFQSVTPVLFVEAIEPCLSFWTERLGWSVQARVPHGDRLGFVILANDGVQLMYQTHASIAEDMRELEPRDRETSVLLYVSVDDLDAIERALSGSAIVVPRRTTFYGAIELGVREPGGNVVVFSKHS